MDCLEFTTAANVEDSHVGVLRSELSERCGVDHVGGQTAAGRCVGVVHGCGHWIASGGVLTVQSGFDCGVWDRAVWDRAV